MVIYMYHGINIYCVLFGTFWWEMELLSVMVPCGRARCCVCYTWSCLVSWPAIVPLLDMELPDQLACHSSTYPCKDPISPVVGQPGLYRQPNCAKHGTSQSTNSTSCCSLWSWQLHDLKSFSGMLFFFLTQTQWPLAYHLGLWTFVFYNLSGTLSTMYICCDSITCATSYLSLTNLESLTAFAKPSWVSKALYCF